MAESGHFAGTVVNRHRKLTRGYSMASNPVIEKLKETVSGFVSIDEEKLVRRSLGEESLEQPLTSLLSQAKSKAEFALKYAEFVGEAAVNHINSNLSAIIGECNTLAATNNQDFIASKKQFLTNFESYMNSLLDQWAPFVAAAIEERGILSDKGIREAHDRTLAELTEESERILEELKSQSVKVMSEAREMAANIETRARRTAQKISVKEAQDQFEAAQIPLIVQLVVWSILSISSIAAFFVMLYLFMGQELDPEWTWRIVYYTTIRLAGLGALGSIAAYCLKILRSQLHMFQRNQHRQRVANCMEALVESTYTPEQRDLIYAHLVEAITQFGETGLIERGEKDQLVTKLSIDNITRSIVAPKTD